MITPKKHFQKYNDFLKPPRSGDIVKGKVIGKSKDGIILDLENFKTGAIPKEDLKYSGKNLAKINIGEEMEVKIIEIENKKEGTILSLREAKEDLVWNGFQELKEKNEKIKSTVVGANKGGLIFNISQMQGFLPASQLSKEHYPKVDEPSPDKVLKELKKFIGQEMEVKIIQVDPQNKRLILSEK